MYPFRVTLKSLDATELIYVDPILDVVAKATPSGIKENIIIYIWYIAKTKKLGFIDI